MRWVSVLIGLPAVLVEDIEGSVVGRGVAIRGEYLALEQSVTTCITAVTSGAASSAVSSQ